MRKLIVLVIAACALAVLAATAMAATRTVKVGDDYFVRPKGVAEGHGLRAATTVRFDFSGADSPHTVTRLSGPELQVVLETPAGARSRSAAPTGSTARSTACQISR